MKKRQRKEAARVLRRLGDQLARDETIVAIKIESHRPTVEVPYSAHDITREFTAGPDEWHHVNIERKRDPRR